MALLLTAAIVFVLDRLTKGYVASHLLVGQSRVLMSPWLTLTYVRNAGAAFGILQHWRVLFIVVAIVVSLGIAWYGRRASPALQVALGLVLGGALGNLYDRILTGTVIDFINVKVWPVFNVADAAVVIGVIGLVLRSLRGDGRRARRR